jgi:type IV fimbrial biogenesis protein FimT
MYNVIRFTVRRQKTLYKILQDAKAFTLVEVVVVFTIVAILAALGIPAMENFFKRSRLSAAVNATVNELKYARSEAIKTNNNVFVTFTNGTSWCYALSNVTGCDCNESSDTKPDYCIYNTVRIAKAAADYEGVTLTQSFTDNEIAFEKLDGSIVTGLSSSPQTLTLSISDYSAEIKVYSSGLVTVCSNSSVIGNYPKCTTS